jgi:hypothetical protein
VGMKGCLDNRPAHAQKVLVALLLGGSGSVSASGSDLVGAAPPGCGSSTAGPGGTGQKGYLHIPAQPGLWMRNPGGR